jgi:hypothetical protein
MAVQLPLDAHDHASKVRMVWRQQLGCISTKLLPQDEKCLQNPMLRLWGHSALEGPVYSTNKKDQVAEIRQSAHSSFDRL